MQRRQFFALGLALLAGCGATQSASTPTLPPVNPGYDTSPKAVILEQTQGGGFMMSIYRRLEELPQLRLYGDGRMIYQHYDDTGAMSWMEKRLQRLGVETLLTDVLGPQQELCQTAEIPMPPIADAPSTRITVQFNEFLCDASANALGMEGERTGITPAGVTLLRQLTHAHSTLEALRQQKQQLYQPAEVTLAAETSEPNDQATPWPFNGVEIRDGATISGADAAKILEFAGAPKPVKAGEQYYMLVALPALP